MEAVESKFDSAKGRDIKYMFLDACYDEGDEENQGDPDEKEAFDNSMEQLYKLLKAFPGLETSKVNDKVETAHAKIKRELLARAETNWADVAQEAVKQGGGIVPIVETLGNAIGKLVWGGWWGGADRE